MIRPIALILAGALVGACATRGTTWINEPLTEIDDEESRGPVRLEPPARNATVPDRFRTRVIGGTREPEAISQVRIRGEKLQGNVVGTFRNTYYDFPSEADFSGEPVPLYDAACGVIENVPRGFFESVCVQGSGLLQSGRTVSFAKRDCACARVCPRTDQKICYDRLDPKTFPWGRGALGKPITPLLTVAVDDSVIPMESPVYIPEYDGVPRDPEESAVHDGCFIAQDRGVRVKGQHVDVFTGHQSITLLWNRIVPSNEGVTVVLDSPRCARTGRVQLSEPVPE